jgi:hypothetical protein
VFDLAKLSNASLMFASKIGYAPAHTVKKVCL